MKAITHNLDSEWLPHKRQSREASSRRPSKMSTYLWFIKVFNQMTTGCNVC